MLEQEILEPEERDLCEIKIGNFYCPEEILNFAKNLEPLGVSRLLGVYNCEQVWPTSADPVGELFDRKAHPEYVVPIYYALWEEKGKDFIQELFPLYPIWDYQDMTESLAGGILLGDILVEEARLFVEDLITISFENRNLADWGDISDEDVANCYNQGLSDMLKTVERIPQGRHFFEGPANLSSIEWELCSVEYARNSV